MDDSEVLGFWSEGGRKNVSYNRGFLTEPVRSQPTLTHCWEERSV
jgi:hypothetical protein